MWGLLTMIEASNKRVQVKAWDFRIVKRPTKVVWLGTEPYPFPRWKSLRTWLFHQGNSCGTQSACNRFLCVPLVLMPLVLSETAWNQYSRKSCREACATSMLRALLQTLDRCLVFTAEEQPVYRVPGRCSILDRSLSSSWKPIYFIKCKLWNYTVV